MVTGYSAPANEANKTSFLNCYKHCGGFAAPKGCESAGRSRAVANFVFFLECAESGRMQSSAAGIDRS
jgi:hypothetical protein